MKKIIVLFLALVMMMSFPACSDKGQTGKDSDMSDSSGTDASPASSESLWFVDYYVDDFGDKGNDPYIRTNTIEGTFSNTATSGSPLSVALFYAPDFLNPEMHYVDDGRLLYSDDAADVYSFRLLEYNKTPATYISGDTMIIKYKIDGSTYSANLNGSAPNGDVYLSWSTVHGDNTTKPFTYAIFKGQEIKCVIEIGSSKYSFTIPETNTTEFKALRDSLREERDKFLLGEN